MEKRELIKKSDKVEKPIKKNGIDKKLIIIFSTFIIAVIVAIGAYFFMPTDNKQIKENSEKAISTSPNESFVFKTIKGQTFKIDASLQNFKIPKLQNRIVFLKVFGWDCKYCQKEIPELIKLKNQFDGAFDVIAIESQHHTTQENQKLANEKGITVDENIITWSEITEVISVEDAFLLYYGSSFLFIPKYAFESSDEKDRFSYLAKESVKSYRRDT